MFEGIISFIKSKFKRYGTWTCGPYGLCQCSECGKYTGRPVKHCPHCKSENKKVQKDCEV